jgi:hypothetical protein
VSSGTAAPYIQQLCPRQHPRVGSELSSPCPSSSMPSDSSSGSCSYRPRAMQVVVAFVTLALFNLNHRVSIYYDQLRAVGFYRRSPSVGPPCRCRSSAREALTRCQSCSCTTIYKGICNGSTLSSDTIFDPL